MGAGVVSFFFVPDDCAVIELRYGSIAPFADQIQRASTELGQRYAVLECDRVSIPGAVTGDGNLHVPTVRLARVIETAIAEAPRRGAAAAGPLARLPGSAGLR
jgi:hypothetical protein